MDIRARLLLSLALAAVLLGGGAAWLAGGLAAGRIGPAEELELRRDLQGIAGWMSAVQERLTGQCRALARDPDGILARLGGAQGEALLESLGLVAVARLDAAGTRTAVAVAGGRDPAAALPFTAPGCPLMAVAAAGRSCAMPLADGRQVLVAAAAPIGDPAAGQPLRGTLVVVRELDAAALGSAAGARPGGLSWGPPGRSELAVGEVVVGRDGDLLSGRLLLGPPGGPPTLALLAERSAILPAGGAWPAGIAAATALVVLLAGGLLLRHLEVRLLAPLRRLRAAVDRLHADPAAGLPRDGAAEVGAIASAMERAVGRERAANRDLALSRTRYAALFEHTAAAVLVLDGERVVEANRAAAGLLAGGDRERLLATPLPQLVASEDPHDDESSSWSASGTGEGTEWIMRRLDGSTFRAGVRSAITAFDGRSATQLILEDRGVRRREEQERALLALLAESTSEAILVATPRGKLVYINLAGRRLLGLAPEVPTEGLRLGELMSAEAWERMAEQMIPAVLAEGAWRGEGELVPAGGTPIPVLQSAVALADRRGRSHLVGLVVRDLSRERERERELRAALDTAVDAARARQDFLSTVSHELRTPLNGVIGMTSLLLATRLAEDQREFADTIRICGANLLALINDILDLSRIEAGSMALEHIPFPPRELVEDATQIVAERAAAKGLVIASVIDPAVPARLLGDPTRLRQVLVNLLSNAVKFTERGEVVAELAIADDGRVELTVRDTGIGIPAEVLPGLFRPFVQADSSTTRRFGGSGLGLAICRRLVELMGGEIAAASEPGRGSSFTCRLPLPPHRASGSQRCLACVGDGLLVVVHPHPATRRSFASRLAWLGLRSLALEEPPAAPLCGVQAVIAPWSLIGGARTFADAFPGAALLATAPLTARPDLRLAGEAGVQAVISEPVRTDNLVQVLAAALANGLGSAPASRRRVLVVEDDGVNRVLAMRVVEAVGHDALGADSADQALALLEHEEVDLVLMDCQLPGMDGLEATRRLRARERAGGRRVLVVALTGQVDLADRQRCLAAGMDEVLTKPYAVSELAGLLARLLPR